ncbi:SAM-dependent methyltransferase [Luedemannella helvata]|uniref:SAM-dependent methyltransferase n=1 Tax=Luedemannella helvata TaxID=349315 RepID=A0ABP4VT71_9ACTN
MAGVEERAPVGIDVSVPHSARIYNFWTGGKDNFAADRAMAQAIEGAIPSIRAMAMANRDFVLRAVEYLSREAGIRQFIDIGTGIPASPNVHETAQAIAPGSRVVYVDNDPIVLAHARALLVSNSLGSTAYIDGDLRDPASILDTPQLRTTVNLDEPVALLLVAVLMLVREEDNPLAAVRSFLDKLAPGSYVVITHPTGDFDPPAMKTVVETATHGGMTFVARSREQVEEYFAGWEFVEPGVVPVLAWRPEDRPDDEYAAYYWAGVARKPG